VAKKNSRQGRPARKRRSGSGSSMARGKTTAAVVGAHGMAALQGQLDRKLNESGHKQAPRVLGIVSGLSAVALAVTGKTNAAIVMLGSSAGQTALESSRVDFWPAKTEGE